MRRAAKKDGNHNDVADGLRKAGYSVLDLYQLGNGVPDIAVGWRGGATLCEIKDGSRPPSERKLTQEQEEVLSRWDGNYIVVISLEDALTKLAALKGESRAHE